MLARFFLLSLDENAEEAIQRSRQEKDRIKLT